LATCESRDVKGLYQRARNGEIPEFTGINSPYEEPENPEIILHTDRETLDESTARLLEFIVPRIRVRRDDDVSI
jgi:adenylylsulfate kinase-like enzyme